MTRKKIPNILGAIRRQEDYIVSQVAQGVSLKKIAERLAKPGAMDEKDAKRFNYGSLHDFVIQPHIVRGIESRVTALIRGSDMARARFVLVTLMERGDISPVVRVTAAKALLDMADKVKARDGEAANRSPSEMSSDALRATIERLQGEMAKRAEGAKLIEGDCVPDMDDEGLQVSDILG